jgi:hypothetical protein
VAKLTRREFLVERHVKKRKIQTGFWWGKPQGKTQLGRPRCRREDTIKIELKNTFGGGVN